MAHTILRSDLDAMLSFSHVDIHLGIEDGITILQVPVFLTSRTSYIVKVRLVPNLRPKVEWTHDQSTMYSEFIATSAEGALTDGLYSFESRPDFEVKVEDGIPTRADFTAHDHRNVAWCCPQARSFLLKDPTIHRYSCYVQLTENLLIECTCSKTSRVYLWRNILRFISQVRLQNEKCRRCQGWFPIGSGKRGYCCGHCADGRGHGHRCQMRRATCSAKRNKVSRRSRSPSNRNQCIVCEDRRIGVLCQPCGHLVLCSICGDHIRTRNNRCPTCRIELKCLQPVFGR